MLTLDKVYHAGFVLKDVIRKTDLIHAPKINSESDIYLKTENLQITGSFKVRGAYYKISQLILTYLNYPQSLITEFIGNSLD